jgi:very-short-patch-repair endonuclease
MRRIRENARSLRNAGTDAERHLWQFLRRQHLGGYKFRRQYPIAGYIADFACVEARLVIELDGGQHVEHQANDAARSRKLAVNGYSVLRFWNDDVFLRTEDVLEEILRHLPPGEAERQ